MKAGRISRKVVFVGLITIFLCSVVGSIAFAGISKTEPWNDDYCNLCHIGGTATDGTTNQTCLDCHSSNASSTTYSLSRGGETVLVPVVHYSGTAAPTEYLAGGNFWWVKEGLGGDDTKGHNIFSGEPDDYLDPAPGDPGPGAGCSWNTSCHRNLHTANDMSMPGLRDRQGCTKCHMLEDFSGPTYEGDGSWHSHHLDDSNLVVGSAVGDDDGYFRFLKGHQSGDGHGVSGIEDIDWQASSSPTDHNEYLGYSGSKNSTGNISALGHTMTGYCGGCHGHFHISSGYASGGDWIRHPAGAILPTSGEFASYTTYNPLAPVARPDLSGYSDASSTVTPGTDLANCLSCHRAHASPYPKMLRWDPTDADGCAVCHTSKVANTEGQYHVSDVVDCNVCHAAHGEGPPDFGPHDNDSLIAEVMTTPNSGDRVVTYPISGGSAFVRAASPWDGVCEVCHTQTTYHRNDGLGASHYDDQDCLTCHSHSDEFLHSAGNPGATCMDADCHGYPSHATHFDSTGKGPGIPLTEAGCYVCHADPLPSFKDSEPLATTTVCDACHSPLGAFPGVSGLDDPDIGAKANWPDDFTVSAEGIYEADGVTLKSGKEEWCTTCHDDEAASSRPGPDVEIVIDNADAEFECTWGTSSTGGYNGDYRWHAAGDGSCTATWTPDLPAAATYNVYAWWKASTNRATDAPYTIYYDGGSETVDVNQQIDDNQWNLLGTYPFATGTSGYVVLSDDANQYVIADAIKLDNGTGEATTNAPNVSGDNVDYGFYVTGHKIDCLSCHDASKKHIDHEHRTYEVDDSTGAAINPYGDSYRLGIPSNKPSRYLCFACHNGTEVLGQNQADVSHTNFWNDDTNDENSHWLHAVGFTGIHFDSDWDGTIDSTESCITCHNVHGSPTEAMIRHGELISTYGTTDKVPALNFTYVGSASLVGSTGGSMNYAGPSVGQNGVCWACHGPISYYRTPFLGPRVIMGQGDPEEVANEGSGTSTISVFISDPDGPGDIVTVEIDLTPIGGRANQPMNDDGGGYYSYGVGIPADTPDSPLTFEITATDFAANTGEGEATLIVVDPDSMYVDNADATLVCDWGTSGAGGYGGDYRWHAAGTGSCTATWTPDVPSPETYNVYAWWKASSNRAADAKYTIFYDGGSQTIAVNQEIGSSQWNYLGNFLFAAGTSGYVVLSDDADEYVVADAIKLTPSPPPPPETVIVDNPDAQFVCYWGTSSTGGYNDDYRWHAAGTGSCTATWTPNLVAAASYRVYAWWKASLNRATDAPYTIYYDGGSQTVDVNQEINGGQWNLLGTFPFAAGQSGYLVLSDDANEHVIADAVKFEP